MRGTAEAARFAGDLLARIGRDAEPAPSIRERIQRAAPHAAAVLAPDSADAVAEVLAICSAEAWPVRIAGAACGGLRDTRPVLVLSCHRLAAITEHEPADLVVGTSTGISLRRLAAALAEHGQWLPLDPADPGEGTVGGILARAAAGPLRAGHGTPRDMVLGLEVVTGDGRRLRFGGRVVKNVAGYDVVRLLVGSGGRLGALTHAFLRLRGRPHADVTLMTECGSGATAAGAACERALRLRDALQPDALEVLSFAPAGGAARTWAIAVRIQGGTVGVSAAVDDVRRLEPAAAPLTDAASWWRSLSQAEAGGVAAQRAAILPSRLAETLTEVAGRLTPGHAVAVHVTAGIVRAWRTAPDPTDGGVLDGLAAAPSADPRVAELTRRLCAIFDPAGILQPPEQPDA